MICVRGKRGALLQCSIQYTRVRLFTILGGSGSCLLYIYDSYPLTIAIVLDAATGRSTNCVMRYAGRRLNQV